MADLIPPGSTLKAGKNAINAKIADLEIEGASQQAQINAEQQARIVADNAHAGAAVAHTADQIQYVSGQSVKQKVDSQQAQINNIIGGPASSAAEVVDGRLGADGTARATLGTLVREIHGKQLAQNDQTAVIKRGLNIINTSQASGTEILIGGRMLVNLLGRDGNFESDSNSDGIADGWQTTGPGTRSFDFSKKNYGGKAQAISSLSGDTNTGRSLRHPVPNVTVGKYLFLVDAITDGVSTARVTVAKVDGNPIVGGTVTIMQTTTSKTLYSKINATSDIPDIAAWIQNLSPISAVGWVAFDGARVYQVTETEYAKIDVDPEYTGEKLADKFPYVDSVQHLRNPAIRKKGKNLLPPLTQWIVHANSVVTEPYKLTLNATANYQYSTIFIPVLPLTTYTINLGNVAGQFNNIVERNAALATITFFQGNPATTNRTFTTSATTAFLDVQIASSSLGTFTFANPQLELGNVATQFEPQNDDYLYLPTVLASNIDGSVRDTYNSALGTVTRRWKTGVVLDGSLTWFFHQDATAYKVVKIPAFAAGYTSALINAFLAKNDGKILQNTSGIIGTVGADFFRQLSGDTNFYLNVADTDSGWGEDYTPTAAEIAAYFYGWQMNNGTVGTKYDSGATKKWTPLVSPKFNFEGKITNSIVENANIARFQNATTLTAPTVGTELGNSGTSYDNIARLDGTTQIVTSSVNGNMAQLKVSCDLIDYVIRKHGSWLFGSAVTVADRVVWLKTNVPKITGNGYATGSSPAGNKVTLSNWLPGTSVWNTYTFNTTASIAKLYALGTANGMVDSNGFVHFLLNADASNGTIASTINIDTFDLDVELNVSVLPTQKSLSYTPYMLDYQLATAVEETIVAEGTIGLQTGGNQIELLEGAVIREKVNPAYGAVYGNYYINQRDGVDSDIPTGSQLKNRLSSFISIYKNGNLDNKWLFNTSAAYGSLRAYIKAADYDATAEYTVTYLPLDKYNTTTNAIDMTLQFKSNPKMVQDQLVQDMADLETQGSINVRAIAELFKRVKALGG